MTLIFYKIIFLKAFMFEFVQYSLLTFAFFLVFVILDKIFNNETEVLQAPKIILEKRPKENELIKQL
jgi:hypothetical protein